MAISEIRKRFNEAFREARNSGDSTFEFEGKKYTTKLAGDAAPKARKSAPDTGDETERLSKRAPSAEYTDESVRYAKRAPVDAASLIPRDSRAPVAGESASGSELGRNISNTLAAMGPGKLAGLGAVGMEMGGAKKAQEAYNRAAATRRTEEGFSPAEAIARRRMMEEASFEGGMKRGGKVKKMAKGGMTSKMSSASRRGDGIATKGKTRGRMV